MQSKTRLLSIQVFLISFTPALKSQRHLKINYSELSYTTGLVSTNVIVTSDLRTDVPELTGFFFLRNQQPIIALFYLVHVLNLDVCPMVIGLSFGCLVCSFVHVLQMKSKPAPPLAL